MRDEPAPRIRWELGKLSKSDVLESGEVACDTAEVMRDGRPHVLLLTDRRLLIARTGLIRRRTTVDAIALAAISGVEASADPVWLDRWGALTISAESRDPVYLEAIPGGRARAEELANAIDRQKDLLRA